MSQPFEHIIGHKKQLAFLRAMHQKQTYAHAYVFSGMQGIGKRTIAEQFAAQLLEAEVKSLQAHPEYIEVNLPIDQKTGEYKRAIPAEAIRDLRKSLSLSAFSDGWRVAIIKKADRLTTTAQNALLKTFEEPRKKTLIILLAESEERILPTIRSRAVNLKFSRVPTAEIEQLLKNEGANEQQAKEWAEYAQGSVALAKKYAAGLGGEQREAVAQLLRMNGAMQLVTLEKTAKAQTREETIEFLKEIRTQVHQMLLNKIEQPHEATFYAHFLRTVEESIQNVEYNGSQSLALERLVFQTNRL